MELNKNTEIRHLPPNIREVLAQILESGDSWKILMEGIPKVLTENNDIVFENKKYSPDEINQIHKHCMAEKINFPALVLFDEWGSSGKIRPNLGHLVKILSELQLYRAADYLCILLKEPGPKRPQDGPGAPVEFPSFAELPAQTGSTSTYGDNQNIVNDNNKGYSNQNKVQLPENPKHSGPDLSIFRRSLDVRNSHVKTVASNRESDAIVTTEQKAAIISEQPPSEANFSEQPPPDEQIIPDLDVLMFGNSNSHISSKTNNETNENLNVSNTPDLSALFQSSQYPNLTESMSSVPIPNLSALHTSISHSHEHDTNHNITTNGYGAGVI